MFDHPAEAEEMGRRGREAVLISFNWNNEEQELLRFYRGVARGHGREGQYLQGVAEN
jgi:hypothetical protein